MKKLISILILIFSFMMIKDVIAQGNFGRPVTHYSKNQRTNLKRFHKGKRHKRYIPFNKSSRVNHPSVNRQTKRTMKRRYNQDKLTTSKY